MKDTSPPSQRDNLYRVLIVDDDLAQAEMVREFLSISSSRSPDRLRQGESHTGKVPPASFLKEPTGKNGYHIDHVESIHLLWQRLETDSFDIVLLDYKLPDGTGLDALDQMQVRGYQIPVVMITGQGTERIAAQAIQRGAADYLIKSGDYLLTLPALIQKTIHAHQLQMSVQRSLEQIRYQAMLLNNVRDAIVVWDLSGLITYWNPGAVTLFGWSADERLGRPVAQFYLPTFIPAVTLPKNPPGPIKAEPDQTKSAQSQPASDNLGQHMVRQCTNREGKLIWISSHLVTLRESGDSGSVVGYMDISHDITRRVEAEQALRESEARYRAIVEDYQTELICRFKPNGTLTFVNERFCQYFEKPRQELLGLNFLYFVPEDERQRIIQHLLSFSTTRPSITLEHRVQLSDQQERWLQRTDRAIFNDQGRIFEFQSVGRDITERKKLEAQIRAAQAHLVQSARLATIGEIASGVAHQIYNPLTTIIAEAQILLRSLPASHNGRDSARDIEQAGWRMQKVVQHLLEFSRPETDVSEALALNDTLQSALSLVGAQIEASSCRLDTNLGKNLAPVRGNARQLESLWVNLLLLALDAVRRRTSKDKPMHKISLLSSQGPPGTVLVEVRDNGEPIPADQLATIFEPNFLTTAGTTASGRGTGMELSVCREIVRQHGGQITADSASDRDTIFRVVLPVEV
ncbi:MAG: PAS domain S-box protein [Chloroflexota bacterium]